MLGVNIIAGDEAKHLAYCHEELLRMVEQGHGPLVRRMLREYALVEIRTYRDVSLAVMGRMGEVLGWSGAKRLLLGAGIRAIYLIERLFTWRRMVTLRPPAIANALGELATSRS